MALQALFDALAGVLGDAVSVGGPDQVDHESRPPRITWEPVKDRFGRPRSLGGGPGHEGPIHTRDWNLRVIFWGESFTATEQLVDAFLGALHNLVSAHSYTPVDSEWHMGNESTKGALCVMQLLIHVPVLRPAQPARPITAINATFGLAME